MRYRTAHKPRVRLNGGILKRTSFEYTAICVVHLFVTFFHRFDVDVKTVRVFHDKFTTAYHTKPRAHLIPEFSLYLVKNQRKVLIRPYFFRDKIGDDFLMGGPEDHFFSVAVVIFDQYLTHIIIPACTLPEFRRMQCRH